MTEDAHSPVHIVCVPRCAATSEDEHAVSTLSVGPLRLKQNARRPDATLKDFPDAVYGFMLLRSGSYRAL